MFSITKFWLAIEIQRHEDFFLYKYELVYIQNRFLNKIPVSSCLCFRFLFQCLLDVGYDIVYIFYTYGKTNQIGTHAGRYQLFVCELAVCMAGRV
ncbi:Uncharacterised protein [Bacteroides heparinolyticus]|uniref:Uncharacterized protein n=1 Tax=Prevotella heparinolytica TaxID=28113 RepID=A0A449I460_9BACE|nr:Uncharacterised protein [Bacteroides heparinolyticus]